MYKCEICEKDYQTIEERAKCELSCFANIKEKDRLEQKKLKAELYDDIKEIQDICDNFDKEFTKKAMAFNKKHHKIMRIKNNDWKSLQNSVWF